MKLQFKDQPFQKDAAFAVCDVFSGQPYNDKFTYLMDTGNTGKDLFLEQLAYKNFPITVDVKRQILTNINNVQKRNGLIPSDTLEGTYNLTVEMETGTGKTYTYIKTIYELNKLYGWCKFIIVVPSVAIREGVYKSFNMTQEHFSEKYNKKIRFFIYDTKNKTNLTEIEHFAMDNSINVMIINSQAFNATGEQARRIGLKLEEFKNRRPIDVIAATNPILIIDEPQSVEGKATAEKLKDFRALFTLRYSATPKKEYNLVYRLDAIDAYNKKLVKKIGVIGTKQIGNTGTDSYIYLSSVNVQDNGNPYAYLGFNEQTTTGKIVPVVRKVKFRDNLYDLSNHREEYRQGYVITGIYAEEKGNYIEFKNGKKIFVGQVEGRLETDQLRRIQIRETIAAHFKKEKELYDKGIKVLSLFFIDEVNKYREYNNSSTQGEKGLYARIFEEEYNEVLKNTLGELFISKSYRNYLNSISAEETHNGYFSKDNKGRMANSTPKGKEKTSDDVDAYDLIMKDKEALLSLSAKEQKNKVRFIFSHSALREGWDNPNVFQICFLKEAEAVIRKRQEVGRGLRLCVNQKGERQDEQVLKNNVQNINKLTIIASESYEDFAKALQGELAEDIKHRPSKFTDTLLINRFINDNQGNEIKIDKDFATAVIEDMVKSDYLSKGKLTDKYYTDKQNGTLSFKDEALKPYTDTLTTLVEQVSLGKVDISDDRADNVELTVNNNKLASKEFKALWDKINAKSYYIVDFKPEELIEKSIKAIENNLRVNKIVFQIESGEMDSIEQEELKRGESFRKTDKSTTKKVDVNIGNNIKYDLVGKIVEGTGLTRADVVKILKGIDRCVFNLFKDNPEDFISKAIKLINQEKATVIIQHIAYDKLDATYQTDIFTENTIKGQLGINTIKVKNHLYNYLRYDSNIEKEFAQQLDNSSEVAVYVKLPSGFKICTPVGDYNPDWAIAFHEDKVKHIFFVAETKGTMDTLELRSLEATKIACARKHFKAISSDTIRYDVVNTYEALLNKVLK